MAHQIFFGRSKVEQTAASAFVESFGGSTKVRLNFVQKTKTSSAYGMNDSNDNAVLDAQVYQNAFDSGGMTNNSSRLSAVKIASTH